MTRPELVLRPVEEADVAELAAVQVAARAAAPMPPSIHPEHEIRAFLAGRLGTEEMWLGERRGEVAAYARFTRTWLDDLYVHPAHQGAGMGGALLELVMSLRPGGFGLWVFESNTPARAFYTRRGLVETERTDGSANEEHEPDVRMEWHGG